MPLWKDGPNDLGDTNVVIESDARWCGVMWSKNKLQKSGFASGVRALRARSHHLRRLRLRSGRHGAVSQAGRPGAEAAVRSRLPRLLQPARRLRDRDGQPAEVAADGAVRDLHVSALDLGNFGYSGRVTLEALVTPADPTVTAKLAATVADLTTVDEAATTLTVTTTAAASPKERVIAVRGRDAAGKIERALSEPARAQDGRADHPQRAAQGSRSRRKTSRSSSTRRGR